MNGPIPADHPGMTTPGRPGAVRYICSFCPWFHDFEPAFGMGFDRRMAWRPDPDDVERVMEVHMGVHVQEMMQLPSA